MTLDELLKIIDDLPINEQKLLFQRIIETNDIKEHFDVYDIREGIHESNPIECPSCKSRNWIKFGQYRGLQKYRCSECKRTFTALTGSSAYRIHDKEKWSKYFSCLLAGYSLQNVQTRLELVIRHPLIGDIRF